MFEYEIKKTTALIFIDDKFISSGIIFKLKDQPFVITAGHTIYGNDFNQEVKIDTISVKYIDGDANVTQVIGDKAFAKNHDIVALKLEQILQNDLPDIKFATLGNKSFPLMFRGTYYEKLLKNIDSTNSIDWNNAIDNWNREECKLDELLHNSSKFKINYPKEYFSNSNYSHGSEWLGGLSGSGIFIQNHNNLICIGTISEIMDKGNLGKVLCSSIKPLSKLIDSLVIDKVETINSLNTTKNSPISTLNDEIIKSSIWQNSLDKNSKYSINYKDDVELLRSSFFSFRMKAEAITEFVKNDYPDIIFYDTNQFDALWENACTVAGDNIDLNPLEVFIFGCSVIILNIGKILSLTEESLDKIKNSPQFKDIIWDIYNEMGNPPSKENLDNPQKNILYQALEKRLDSIFISRIDSLPSKVFNINKIQFSVIEPERLRQVIGGKISEIIQGFYSSIDEIRLAFNQRTISPSFSSFPKEWTINNVKIIALLRTSARLFIDDRSSSKVLFSYNPAKFYQKLNRAIYSDDRITFTSHTKFDINENKEWWSAYNTILDIDRELKSIDNLLIDLKIESFQAKGVKGISNPYLFSKYVQTNGWEPAETQYKISDFHSLIQKLGGKQLYGDYPYIPLRELLQNACDALSAKRHYAPDSSKEIKVNYFIHQNGDECLEIKDNGIGMSKSALLYGLLDFGNSYWKSPLSRKEHPGLSSSGFTPTGNFGIGFFSVFMIANKVQVITKPITDGSKTIVLEFTDGIGLNPILREATYEEKRFESGTTIRLYPKEKNLIDNIYKFVAELSDVEVENPLAYICRRIAPALPYKLTTCMNNSTNTKICLGNDWKEISSLTLLNRISGFSENEIGWNFSRLKYISEFIRPIYNIKGEMIARATLVKRLPSNNDYSGCGVVTVGGLKQSKLYRFPGLWVGSNKVVNRNQATPVCTFQELIPWLEEQYDLIIGSSKLTLKEKIEAARVLCSLTIPCEKLPIARTSDGWKTYEEITKMNHGDHVLLRFCFNESEHSLQLLPNIISAEMGALSVHIDNNRNHNHRDSLWIKDLEKFDKEKNSIAKYSNTLTHRSVLGYTIKAICESWGVSEQEVINESIVDLTKWQPLIPVYKNRHGDIVKEAVHVITNPKLCNKQLIYKKYEAEIKQWANIPEEEEIDFRKIKE